MTRTMQQITQFYRERGAPHVAFDSRVIQEGTLFFALKGEKVDGHTFLKNVAEKRGVAAVVSEDYQGESFGLKLFPVKNVKEALHELARAIFVEKSPTLIGVTGSAGKTTTKEFIATLLAEKFPVAKNTGSMNSQVSLPLTVLNWKGEEKVMVLEMGMSQPGEITRLIQIAPPDLAVLTNINYQHAEFFPHIEGIAQAKCEIFGSSKTKKGILSLQTEQFECVRNLTLPKIWYQLSDLESMPVRSPFVETHMQENFLAAVLVAREFGLTWEEIERGAKKCTPYKHRFEKVEKKGVLFVDDSYNASPVSVKAALNNLPKGKRQIGFLSDMAELGAVAERSHIEVGECAVKTLDRLICIGAGCLPIVEIFKREQKQVDYFDSKEEAAVLMKQVVEEGDVVLIKGRNSLKLWTVLEEI